VIGLVDQLIVLNKEMDGRSERYPGTWIMLRRIRRRQSMRHTNNKLRKIRERSNN
jgi:hypothetical protein